MPPANWPDGVRYISRPQYAPAFPPAIKAQLCAKPDDTPAVPSQYLKIQRIKDKAHPAFQQLGLFAGRRIPPNSLLIYYAGEIHVDERPTSDYDLALFKAKVASSDASDSSVTYINVGIDAAKTGNEGSAFPIPSCQNSVIDISRRPIQRDLSTTIAVQVSHDPTRFSKSRFSPTAKWQ